MSYKIAICDDNLIDRQYVSSIIESWAKHNNIQANISNFTSAENFLFNWEDNCDYDILILDIEMKEMDGVSLAKEIRKSNNSVQIIFITGYSDYIAEGYEVAALHYLMKPVKEEKLFSVLDRAVEKIGKNEKILTLEHSGEMIRIPIYQIKYAEVYGNYVTIHANVDITVKMTLGKLEEQLDERFFRTGRSYIINLTMVSRVTKSEIKLDNGVSIPLPRGSYESINRAIINLG